MENNVLAIASLAVANIAGLVTFFVSLKVNQAKMEVRLEWIEKDLNRLGIALGTQRAKAEQDNKCSSGGE